MRKKKTIVINDPQLMRIRSNLRNVFLEAIYCKWYEYHEQDIRKRGSRKYAGLKQELESIKDDSICYCPRCSANDKNMTFNPVEKRWYCVQCYLEMQHWTAKKKTGESFLFP